MPVNIDVVRGVSMRKHSATGIAVYMYIDTPGVYLNMFGQPVSEKIAAEAGFNTARDGKLREKSRLMDEYMRKVEAQLEMETGTQSVLAERGGYKVVSNGQGYARIMGEDGESLNPMPIPEDQALALLDELIPAEGAEAPPAETGDKDGSAQA